MSASHFGRHGCVNVVALYPGLPMFLTHTRQNWEGLVDFGDVMMTYLPPFLPQFVEMVADA